MKTKRDIIAENEFLKRLIDSKDRIIEDLRIKSDKYNSLSLSYMTLEAKYIQLLNSMTSKNNTEVIIRNGEIYRVEKCTLNSEKGSVDTLNIVAVNVPREKGLIDNLSDAFKETAKEFNKIMFGNDK